ncbi:hypothetical protein SDC9_174341 [bioreactor metagenome]|uniref:Uncharacterized protein n=1 Tax=bioreactor metagenome TaxID=1076179 RepID=A0A645GJM3_9ZZZZ
MIRRGRFQMRLKSLSCCLAARLSSFAIAWMASLRACFASFFARRSAAFAAARSATGRARISLLLSFLCARSAFTSAETFFLSSFAVTIIPSSFLLKIGFVAVVIVPVICYRSGISPISPFLPRIFKTTARVPSNNA